MGPHTSAILLGVALGGFFDGILLHQILQWHHLLSLTAAAGDLRALVLWDGLFHLGHYLLGAAGLWGLWRHRAEAPPILPALLLGFGLWHLVDAVASHWLLGIHRIRDDAANPLAWDLGWLAIFGLVPLALGLGLRGGRGPRTGGIAALAALALGAGAWAARAPDTPFATVVLRPGLDAAGLAAALHAADARLVGGDFARGVIVVDAAPAARWRLYAHGALLVAGTGAPAGCLGWTRA